MAGVLSLRGSFVRAQLALVLTFSLAAVAPAGAGVDVWTNEGPDGAEISAIAVDPGDADTVYVGTNGGGVFKSTDGGLSWGAAREGVGPASVDQIYIDPIDTRTIYAVTATAITNRFLDGVFKSTDGGSTWNAAEEGLGEGFISSLVVDGGNAGTVYAGVGDSNEGGVFKSIDGGGQWMRIFGQPGRERNVAEIALDPSDSQILYASTRMGLFKTANGGKSWDPIGTGLPFADSVRGFAFDPVDTQIVYACGSGGLATKGVYKSADGGMNWVPTATEEAANVKSIFADSAASGALYALVTEGVIKTTDAGGQWQLMIDGLPQRRFRYNAVGLAPSDGERLYMGMGPAAAAPVYRSDDGAASWQARGVSGLTNTFLLSLAIDPLVPRVRYTAAELDEGNDNFPLLKTETSGTIWARSDQGLPNARIVVVDPVESNVVYAGTEVDGVYKSLDAGAMWRRSNIGISGRRVSCLTIAPSDRGILYACVSSEDRRSLFKSSTVGANWEAVSDGLQDADATERAIAQAIAVDPTAAEIVYVATADQGVFKSTDGGQTWEPADTGIVLTDLISLAIDPTNPSIVYAGARAFISSEIRGPGGVHKSTDAGGSWQPANGEEGHPIGTARVHALVVDGIRPQVVYAATDVGVFRSTDGAASWTALDAGLFAPDTRALVIDPLDPNVLHVATFGGGVFSIEQTCGDEGLPCPATPTPTSTPTVTPTPEPCDGDCDVSDAVKLDELVRGVRIALGLADTVDCLPLDVDRDGHVTIDELVRAVGSALAGC